jgi:S-adenosylmethionine:tRNA ribosyltransferase-isomerase
MHLSEFDFDLPSRLIAQRPLDKRDASRMLLFERERDLFQDRLFRELPDLLLGDELLILNNTRVIPARLFGRRAGVHSQPPSRATTREHLSGTVEVLLTRQLDERTWEALVRPGRKLPVGEKIVFAEGQFVGEIVQRGELGLRTICFSATGSSSIRELLERFGHIPLPPYINRDDEPADRERYQTVFATQPGAIAAPTAGLHFTPAILQEILARGSQICEVTLNVGLGTFQPVHEEILEKHIMHAESYEITAEAADRIAVARSARRPILAIGTTVVRALEDSALRASEEGAKQLLLAGKREARLFITPGFQFRVVDALLTNFHLPRSTLLALVCAFAGRERILRAYSHAVEQDYRFYSYGDCMLIR